MLLYLMMKVFKVITPNSGLIETLACLPEVTEEDLRSQLLAEDYPSDVIVVPCNFI